jgi:hypothetical protein
MEMWNGHVMKNWHHLCVFDTGCYIHIPKKFHKKFYNKSVFGRMIGYLNYQYGHQLYMPLLNKIVHLHIHFKLERICTSSVVKMGWTTQLWKMWLRICGRCSCGEKPKWHNVRVVTVWENLQGGDQGRVFEEHRKTNQHGQAASVHNNRGLHSSVSMHCYGWW